MRQNRSIPPVTVVPVLVYPDVRAAVAWLAAAFGFVERVRIGEGHRAQLSIGDDGAVIVAEARGDQQPPRDGVVNQVLKVRVEDVDAFPGHIACDSASRSELVVPLMRGDAIVGVIDLDSPTPGRFDADDRAGIEDVAERYLRLSD